MKKLNLLQIIVVIILLSSCGSKGVFVYTPGDLIGLAFIAGVIVYILGYLLYHSIAIKIRNYKKKRKTNV